jgi:8-oxo-dGTP diphosphatase
MASDPICPSDLDAYPAPHLAVDLVLLTICDGALKVLMMERGEEPFAGQLVLPGGFVHPREMLDDTARRVMAEKVKLGGVAVEQLYSFSGPDRDPRGWVVSVAYFALMPCAQLTAAMDEGEGLQLVTIEPREVHDVGLTLDGEPVGAGFDHHAIITTAVERLRGKLDWSMVAFGLLPEEFTLLELLRVHEIILGRPLLKPPFRKKMLERTFADGRCLSPTGRFSRPGRHRPAELYRLAPSTNK